MSATANAGRRATASLLYFVNVVLRKEMLDALRDHRTLMRTLLPALVIGPLMLIGLSAFIGSMEEKAEKRELLVQGIEHAPTLQNFLARNSYTVKSPPEGYEAQLRQSKLTEAVVVVQPDFEAKLLAGQAPELTVVSDSTNQRAEISARMLQRALQGFERERAQLQLTVLGVAPQVLQSITLEEKNLASQKGRGAQLTGMIPFFILSIVLVGSLTAALDSTAGERERRSLEPLLMNPASPLAFTLGKWGAASLLGAAVALASLASFIPAQAFIQNDELKAMFQFGWAEAWRCWALLVPLSMMVAALTMTLAMRTKSFKEAQASAGLLISVMSLLPLIGLLNPGGEQDWYSWVPGLSQFTLLNQVMKGEALLLAKVLPSVLTSLALLLLALGFTARSMKQAVAR
jgi:sodium transport system permease protein